MKKFIVIMAILIIGCNTKENRNLSKTYIHASCEKIIIMDSIDSKTIAFVVSFENNSETDIVLFANSAYKKTKKDSYKKAGLILKREDFSTPIGVYIPKILHIEPNSTKKYVFLFSEQYPNGWIDLPDAKNMREELTAIAESVSLSYKYDVVEMQKILDNKKMKELSAKTISEDFEVEMSNSRIEYNNNLSIEDVVKISGGKVRIISD